jgi:hypothetical protein
MSEVLSFLRRLTAKSLMPWLLGGKGLPEWLTLGDGANNAWFAPACCLWLSLTYECTRRIGKRFQWEPVQVLQVYRSTQVNGQRLQGRFSFAYANMVSAPPHLLRFFLIVRAGAH